MMCPCGQKVESTAGVWYQTATYNEKGEVIFAICSHGIVVIDKPEEEKK